MINNQQEALNILTDFRIERGVIIINGVETDEQNEAIDYLCEEWDYSALTIEDYKKELGT